MDNFINVIEKDRQVRIEINDLLDRCKRISYKYPSKRGYDILIQNVILTEVINIMSAAITDIDIELKMKISRIKCLGIRLL